MIHYFLQNKRSHVPRRLADRTVNAEWLMVKLYAHVYQNTGVFHRLADQNASLTLSVHRTLHA